MSMNASQTGAPARLQSLELLRTVSMLLVILMHVLLWGTTLCTGSEQVTFASGGINSAAYCIFQPLSTLGVICFLLITCYFISGSNVLRFDRLLKVWAQTAFYSVLMAVIASFFIQMPVRKILLSFVPIFSNQYWFVTKYVGLMVLAPIFSYAVQALDRKGFTVALISVAAITMTISVGFPYGDAIFGGAYTMGSLILIFFIGAYLKKFGIPEWLSKNCGKLFLASIAIQVLGALLFNVIRKGNATIYGGFSVGYNAFSIVPATALFVMFKEMDLKDNAVTRFLLALAPYSFAAYLIHDNQYIREILWTKIFHLPELWSSPLWTLSAILIPFAILIVCCGIDVLRTRLFGIAGFDRLVEKVRKRNIPLS